MAARFFTPLAHVQVVFFLRQLIGFWFFMLGRWKVFDAHEENGANMIVEMFRDHKAGTWIPEWMLVAGGYFDMYAEFLCGLMLIFGLGVRAATWILMALLVMVTFGHQAQNATYGLGDHVMPAALGLVGIAILAGPGDKISLDHALRILLNKRKPSAS